MTRYAQLIELLALCLCAISVHALAQSSSVTFVTYRLQYKTCDELAELLRPLLPEAESAGIQLVTDHQQNRLLLSGPNYVHEIARKLIREVDRPLASSRQGSSTKLEIRTYRLGASQHHAFLQDVHARFGAAVRTSSDPATGSIFVTASPEAHTHIQRLAADYHSGDEPQRSPTAAAPPNFRRPEVTESPATYARFVSVPAAQLDRIQQQLVAIFSARLTIRSIGARQILVLQTAGEIPSQLEIEFDRSRSGVLIGGTGTAATQLVVLIESLAQSSRPGRAAKVFRLRRDNHQRLRDVIDRGSVSSGDRQASQLASSKDSKIRRLPAASDLPRDDAVQWVRYLFQEESADAANQVTQAAGQEEQTDAGEVDATRQFEGVDVESLPDLDVIILRGPEQDLDQLSEIIKQLERISRDTQPDVQVYPLEHAQSEALAEIIEDVSGDLVGGRQGRVAVVPLIKPNSLLLIGWGDAVAAIKVLIQQLDTPVAAESQSRIFRLKHAAPAEIQQTLLTFFSNRGGLGPRIQLATDARTNSLIVYAAPRDLEEIAKLIADIDRPGGEAINRARLFRIENALAGDVAETLQRAIQAVGNGDRAAVLELQTFDAEGQQILRSGTLRGVQITPNVGNNTIVVTSPIENLELIAALIKQLDTPAGQAKIKVFRIVNGDAAALVQTLRSLIPSQTGGTVGTPQLGASGEAGLAPLRFSVDARSNSIIATGSEGDLRIVEALLAKLDQSTSMQRQTAVYRLKNSPAIDVANAVNQYLFNRRQLESAAPGQTNPFAEIEREVVVVPEPIANKLILAATPRYFEEIQRLIEKLDESPPQVMIQVLIAEVALNDADEFGVELGLQDSVLFDRSLLGDLITTTVNEQTSTPAGIVTTTQDVIQAATNIPGFAFNSTQPLGNSGSSNALANAGNVGGQGISNFAVGRANDQLGFGGLVLSASSKNVNVLLRALRESRRVDVLSRPQIRTLDNQPAYIQVGQRVPRIVGSTVNQNGQSNSVSLENVGLILGVTPRVSPDGTVVMEIDAEKSSLGPEQDGIPVAVSVDGTVIRSPRVDTTTAQATVSAADGETIVLGGLITENGQYVHRSVPVLGEIPILERFFRFDSHLKRRTELLIILTPRVIRSPEDSEQVRQLEMSRMSWCACDVYRLMDDIGYRPESNLDHVELGTPEVIYPDLNPTAETDRPLPPEPLQKSGETGGLLMEPPMNRVPIGGAE